MVKAAIICLIQYRVQGFDDSYHPDFESVKEVVKDKNGVNKDGKFIVFESQLMQVFQRCHSCGLEVKLETSIRGTLLVVNGICPDGHVLSLAIPANVKGYGSWEFAVIRSYPILWSYLH